MLLLSRQLKVISVWSLTIEPGPPVRVCGRYNEKRFCMHDYIVTLLPILVLGFSECCKVQWFHYVHQFATFVLPRKCLLLGQAAYVCLASKQTMNCQLW